MDKKTGLNNVQRKMLDEIYTEQFENIAQPIIDSRKEKRNKLVLETLKKESNKTPLKELLSAHKAFTKTLDKARPYLREKGLGTSGRIDEKMEIKLADRWDVSITHPDLVVFDEKTNEILRELAEKKKEIRARVYGMETTYEQVEKEITKELSSIKIKA